MIPSLLHLRIRVVRSSSNQPDRRSSGLKQAPQKRLCLVRRSTIGYKPEGQYDGVAHGGQGLTRASDATLECFGARIDGLVPQCNRQLMAYYMTNRKTALHSNLTMVNQIRVYRCIAYVSVTMPFGAHRIRFGCCIFPEQAPQCSSPRPIHFHLSRRGC